MLLLLENQETVLFVASFGKMFADKVCGIVNGIDVDYYNPVTATNKWIRSRPVITTIGKHTFCE